MNPALRAQVEQKADDDGLTALTGEKANSLRLVLFENLEVLFVEVGDEAPLVVGYGDRHDDFIHTDANRLFISALFVRLTVGVIFGGRRSVGALGHIGRRNGNASFGSYRRSRRRRFADSCSYWWCWVWRWKDSVGPPKFGPERTQSQRGQKDHRLTKLHVGDACSEL